MSAPPPAERPAPDAGLRAAPPPPHPPRPPPLDDPRFVYLPRSTDYADLPAMLGHPDLGRVILGWLGDDTRAASALRGTCAAARDAVGAHPWADLGTCIVWPGRWRRAFPCAVAACVRGNERLSDADFVHLRGLRLLDMSGCGQRRIMDGAFAHLTGIHTLKMSWCQQATITDGAFAHLAGIHTLHMGHCIQVTITDAAFAHLAGIHTLNMSGGNQSTIHPRLACVPVFRGCVDARGIRFTAVQLPIDAL